MLHKPRPGASRTRAGSQGQVPGPAQGVCFLSEGRRRPRHHRRAGALEFPRVREGLSGQRSGPVAWCVWQIEEVQGSRDCG